MNLKIVDKEILLKKRVIKSARKPVKLLGNGKLSKRDGDRLGFPVFPIDWTNPETGEIPLRTGLANALLDKNAKNKPDLKGLDKKKLKMSLGKSKVEINPDVEIGVFSGGKQTPSGNLH